MFLYKSFLDTAFPLISGVPQISTALYRIPFKMVSQAHKIANKCPYFRFVMPQKTLYNLLRGSHENSCGVAKRKFPETPSSTRRNTLREYGKESLKNASRIRGQRDQ